MEINQHINKYDTRKILNITGDETRDAIDYAKLSHFVSGVTALINMLMDNQLNTAATLSALVETLLNRLSAIENQLTSTRVTDSDEIYVSIEEVARLSGYGRKRCKQLMIDAIAKGDIRVNQVAFINKAGNASQTRCRYHFGDCKRFWSPARVKKNARKTAAH